MHRREILASLGTITATSSGVALAGCLEQQTLACEPREGDDHLGEIEHDSTDTVTFRGAIIDIQSSRRVLVDDTTGKAQIYPSEGQAIETGGLGIGDCLTGVGQILPDESWNSRMAVLTVSELRSVGSAQRDVLPASDRPDVNFNVDTIPGSGSCETDVTLQHGGGDSIPADELLVVYRSTSADSPDVVERWWYEVDTPTEPDDTVQEGDEITLTIEGDHEGTLVWRRDWSDQIAGWRERRCR